MIFLQMIAIWFYHSFWFMLISFFITLALNKAFSKLYLSPMIINAIALVVLVIDILRRGQGNGFFQKLDWYFQSDYAINIWMYYLPVVFASVLINVIIGLILLIKKKKKLYNK